MLALLAFLPLAGVLWWALAGPRPEPAELDWSELGYAESTVHDASIPWDAVPDPAWVRREMSGWQIELGGTLEDPLPIAPGRYAAVVRNGQDDSRLTPLANLVGVVEWSVDGEAPRHCAFPAPVPLDRVRALGAAGDSGAEADDSTLAGRCTDDGPVVAVPITRRVVGPEGPLQRVLGTRAESAAVADGVVVVDPQGDLERRHELDPGDALPAYPREVARDTLLRALPDNPAAESGSWADPIYPLAVADEDRVWWVMPITPLDGGDTLTGFQVVAADTLSGGALNPVEIRWLETPQPGPGRVISWVARLLEELDHVDEAELTVRPTLPSAEGDWSGRVSAADDRLRFVIEAQADGEVCVHDDNVAHCRGQTATTGRSSRQ